MVITAAVLAILIRMIRLPTIVAYLLAGLALGPMTGLIEISPAIDLISELGIVLLLFLVGLELNFGQIKAVGKVAVFAGLGQVALSGLLGFLVSLALGFDFPQAAFLAIDLTFSSTVVVVKMLSDQHALETFHGRIAIGILLIQDIVVIVVLTVLAGIADGGSMAWNVVVKEVAEALGGMLLLLGGVLAAAKWLLPRPFAWASPMPGTLFIWSLGWCFLVVTAAHLAHLSIELGAFFAGFSLAQLPYNRDLQHRIKPLMNFFIAIFFVALGVKMAPDVLDTTLMMQVLMLSAVVLISKPLIIQWLVRANGFDARTGFHAGLSLAQISEFSFILTGMGVSAGLVAPRMLALVTLTGMVTIGVSTSLILMREQLYQFANGRGWLGKTSAQPIDTEDHEKRSGHIIVVGMNTLGRQIATRLHERGEEVLAIDTDPRKLQNLPSRTLLGNVEYHDVLEEEGLRRAKLVVSALQIEATNDLLAYRCREAGIRCSVVAVDLSVMENLLELDVAWVMLPKIDVVRAQTAALRTHGLLGEKSP